MHMSLPGFRVECITVWALLNLHGQSSCADHPDTLIIVQCKLWSLDMFQIESPHQVDSNYSVKHLRMI